MAETPAVMPQLHLAVQSGSTRILKEMNRRYTREDYLGLVDRIRNRMPDIALSTDIIVGFPGETEEDFEQTLSLAETVRYAQAYTFIYSKRAGTPAAEIDDPTPHEVILERFNRLVKVIETTAHEYNQGELHTVVPALIEGTSKKNDAVLLGKSPKNQTVHAPIPEGYSIDQLVGKIVDVHVDVAKTWYLSGSVVRAALMVSPGAGLSAVAIVGPTAVGKSDVADRLAARLSSEVLSCDAMQIYRGMDIGTAKMAPDECTAPLRLVDIVEPGVAYSAALYQADARAHVERLLGSGCLPVFCGGTGLYLKAALDEMDFPSGELEDDRRAGYQELAERIGEEELHALLAERDPESAAVIHPHNVRRVIRALEMHDDGISYAQQKSQFSVPREHYHALWFGLTRNREVLYERINLRVDLMFEQGLVDEVRGLMDQGLGDALTSMQAIGYKEIIDAFNGVISMDEARELIKMRSRRYAKRQLSWFKRDDRIVWFDMDEFTIDEVVEDILHRIEAA